MNNYIIQYGGGREKIIQGVNLESALTKYGFTDITIVPLWRNKSNGKYKAYCSETAIVLCTWVEKINSLASKLQCT